MYEYKCQLLRVVDGDTVDVLIDAGFSIFLKQRVRLHGINAPESRTRDLREKEKGIASKNRLKQIITSFGKYFLIKTELDKKGKYGRILGVLYDLNKSHNANSMLVSEGHATEYLGEAR